MRNILNKYLWAHSFSLRMTIFFAERLTLLLESGISLQESLSIMENLETSPYRKKFFGICKTDIEHGMMLSKSIKGSGVHFDPLLITLMYNGESSGSFSEALFEAVVYLKKKDDLKKKIIGSLTYPAFVMCATIGMSLFLVLYIFPKISPLLGSLNIQLPLITRIVQGIYYVLSSYGIWILIAVIILSILGVYSIKKNASISLLYHTLLLTTPILRTYTRMYAMARFASTGALLLRTGRGMSYVCILFAETTRNRVYQRIFTDIHTHTERGVSISNALQKHEKYIPPLLIHMSLVGERTGNIASMFRQCGDIFERDIEEMIAKVASLAEPVLMILMGIIVGSVALSIILPVYEITNHLGK